MQLEQRGKMSTALEEREEKMKRVQWRTHAGVMQPCEEGAQALAIYPICCGLHDSVLC